MKLKISSIVKYVFLIVFGILMYLFFYPRTYLVAPMKEREGIGYWSLTTGSRIAFTFLEGKGIRKPYPVIYLHGGPGGFISDQNITTLLPLTEDGFDVYLYDQAGSGHSTRLKDIKEYTADRHKRDLEEIVKEIGARKVILIGQSWGAILATLFAADDPGKVAKIILTSPGPIQPVKEELADLKEPENLHLRKPEYSNSEANEKVQNVRSNLIARTALLFGWKLASDKEADDFQTCLNRELNKSTVCDTSNALEAEGGGGYYAQIMTVQSLSGIQDPRPKLKDSHLPVLVMKGQCDNQKWGFTNEYLQLFPNYKFEVIPGAGHSISIEQPALYLKTIRDFLKE
ncbi:MAG: alpha/beta hydrolase [Bacteroidota bacterium]